MRPGVLALCALVLVGLALLPAGAQTSGQDIDELGQTLRHDESARARLEAAVSLGRLRDARAVPHLVHGLGDASVSVRGVSATGLGLAGDARAIPALERAAGDADDSVRARAARALERIRSAPPPPPPPPAAGEEAPAPSPAPPPSDDATAVRLIVDSGRRSKAARRLRPTLAHELRTQLGAAPELDLTTGAHAVVLDAAITGVTHEPADRGLAVTCHVRLTVSEPSGRILGMVVGHAQVSGGRSRRALRHLEKQAVGAAVTSARDKLVTYLSTP